MGKFPGSHLLGKLKKIYCQTALQLSDLKLRVGYGITGQQEIGNNNDFLQQYNLGSGSQYFGYSCFAYCGFKTKFNLKWEETTTYNAGLDFDCTTIE
jgi:iron complex outermembrane receptor protein